MQDNEKTQDQLIDELNEMRSKVAESDSVQESLKEEKLRYLEIVDKTSEGIFVIQDGLIRFENQACQDISGYRFGDWSFTSLTGLIVHPEDREMVDRYHTGGVRGETVPSLYEFRIVSKDGTTKWMRMNTSGIMWGGELASLSIITDISERKRAEAEAHDIERRLELALTGADLVLWDVNIQTAEAVYWPERLSTSGYSIDEIAPDIAAWGTRVHPEDTNRIRKAFSAHAKGRLPLFECEYRLRAKDGQWKWISSRGKIVEPDSSGNPLRIIGTSFDITAQKNAELIVQKYHEQLERQVEERTAELERVLQDLKQKTEEQALLLNTIDIQIWYLTDAETHGLVNQSRADFLGKRREEIEGKRLHDFYSQDVADVCTAGNAEVFQSRRTICTEEWIPNAAGEIRLISITKTPKLDEHGNVEYVVCAGTDITERKQVEMALRESEQRLELALEGGSLGLWDWNLKTGRAVWGDWTIRMMGYEADELDPHVRTWKRAVHPDDWQKVSEVLNGHLSGRLPFFEVEYRMRSKSGEWKWLHSRGKVVEYDKEGKPQRITGTMLDVTERRKAEEELGKSEQKYRRLVENAHDIVYTTNPGGRVTFLNPAGLQHIQYSKEELIGRNYLEFIPEEYRGHVSRFYSRQFLKQIPDTYYEFPFVIKSGEIRWYGQKTQLLMENGSIIGFQSIARDITERKRLEEERLEVERKLLHSQKLKSLAVMAGGIAHDFNNQLAVVLGNLELALMDLAPDSVVRPSIMNAIQAGKRSAELSRQIQIYTGNTFYNPVDLDLNELLNTNPIPLKLRVSRNVTLNLESYNALPLIKGDSDQIQCLVTNILINASEAVGDKDGEIRLSTAVIDCDETYLSRSRLEEKPDPGRFVFLEVTDTGCGMDAETQRRIFDPFFSTKFLGRGLGMAKVMGIAKGHHGAIIVDSEVGKGTTIRVLFPVSREVQTASVHVIDVVEPQPAVSVSPTRRKTVLVVDDEAGVRDLAVKRLEVLGYDTIVAGDGEEGVNVFRDRLNEIDLVMLDFKMPKMNGVDAFGELIRIKPDVKVILCSGYTEEAVMQSFPGQRPAGVLHKPYNMEDLKGELDRLLGAAD